MPNSIRYNITLTNTNKTPEYWNPATQAYQTTNPLTDIAPGSYSDFRVRLQGSNPAIIATSTVSRTVLNYAFVSIGDSIERADQATKQAGYDTSPSNQQAHTTPFQAANGATGNEGRQTSTERAVDLINAQYPFRFDAYSVGYPSKTSFYFRRNYLTNFFSTFDFTKYEKVFVNLAFGANDLIYPDQPGDSVDPIDVANNIIYVAQTLASVNPKIKIFISPTLNRTYNDNNGNQESIFVGYDDKRQKLNNSLLTRISSFASGASNIFAQSVGLKDSVFNYPNTWFLDGSHPLIEGQTEIGLERARMLCRNLGLSLTQGVGTEPTPPVVTTPPANPAATITISPQSAVGNTQRTATINFTNFTGSYSAQLIKQPTQASSTNINVGQVTTTNSVSFMPAEDGYYYYFKITPTSGNIFFTDPAILVTVSAGTPAPIPSETATTRDRTNLVDGTQPNTLLAQGVGTNYFTAYANLTKRANYQALDNTTIRFPAFVRPDSSYTKGAMLAFCQNPVAPGSTSSFIPNTKYVFYADGSTLRTLVDGTARIKNIDWIAKVGDTVQLSMTINPSGKPAGIYFYEGTQQIDYISDNFTGNLYLLTGATDDGVVIPPITIDSYGLETY